MRVYIGLGANVGDADATLAWAVRALDDLPGVGLRAVSRLYATAPWGVVDQAEFRNAAVALDVRVGVDPATAAVGLLVQLKDLERAAGRRQGRRWGPRELDLDLLVFGRHRIDVDRPSAAQSLEAATDPTKAAKRLEVPHHDLAERLFVVAPLADLAPRLVPPGWSATVETRRRRLAGVEPQGAVRVIGTWDTEERRWR